MGSGCFCLALRAFAPLRETFPDGGETFRGRERGRGSGVFRRDSAPAQRFPAPAQRGENMAQRGAAPAQKFPALAQIRDKRPMDVYGAVIGGVCRCGGRLAARRMDSHKGAKAQRFQGNVLGSRQKVVRMPWLVSAVFVCLTLHHHPGPLPPGRGGKAAGHRLPALLCALAPLREALPSRPGLRGGFFLH